ncbi:hypothetical protein BC936DRAFT_144007 [Jimgerdemannia flammicorona]|nr:hypothetical protein BC936DRAFT_144007 [Jimgerdemannia flammicorona]
MADANVWRQLPPSIHQPSINTTTIAGYSIPSQTVSAVLPLTKHDTITVTTRYPNLRRSLIHSPSNCASQANLNVDEAVRRATDNAAFLSEMISFSNPEVEDLSTNDVVQWPAQRNRPIASPNCAARVQQELYRDCVNLHDFINEQLWSVSDPQQIAALLSANEEVTSALTQYRKSTEHEELVAVAREFERLKLQKDAGGAVLRPARGHEDEELGSDDLEEDRLANKMKPLTDFKVNAPAKIHRRKPKPNASRATSDAEDAGDSG